MNNIDNITDTQAKKVAKIITRFVPALSNFSYNGFHEKKGMNLWSFSHKFQTKSPNYTFKIIFAEKNDIWRAKIFVYWKKITKELTLGAGKDFEYTIGPCKSFSDLRDEIELKIKNNPIMNHKVYDDDFDFNMDKESIPLIDELKKSKDKLFTLKDKFFDDLKELYKKIKNIPEDKLLDYCRIHNPSEDDKGGFIFTLQKLHQIDYYSQMQKMKHIK